MRNFYPSDNNNNNDDDKKKNEEKFDCPFIQNFKQIVFHFKFIYILSLYNNSHDDQSYSIANIHIFIYLFNYIYILIFNRKDPSGNGQQHIKLL